MARTHRLERELHQRLTPYRGHTEAWALHLWRHRRWRWYLRSHYPTWVVPAVFGRAAPTALRIVRCESGGHWWAHNPSGATGWFQILGGPYDRWANTRLAYAMYEGRGWEPWLASESCWG